MTARRTDPRVANLTNDAAIGNGGYGLIVSLGGPGPDPADAICLTNGGGVTVNPVLAKEVKVSLKALK